MSFPQDFVVIFFLWSLLQHYCDIENSSYQAVWPITFLYSAISSKKLKQNYQMIQQSYCWVYNERNENQHV